MKQTKSKVDQHGAKTWVVNGQFHRLDGPAVKFPNGTKQWWVDGKCHRLDGPAITSKNYYAYYVHGIFLSEENFNKHPLVVFYRLSKESKI
jgi:hypothetical protein